VIVSGVSVINKLNISSPHPIGDKEVLGSFEDLYEAFVHFFSRGAPAERFMANEDAVDRIVTTIEDKHLRAQVKYFIFIFNINFFSITLAGMLH